MRLLYNRQLMLDTAIEAASAAGKLLRKNFGSTLNVNLATQHDIKLELDEQAQQVITASFSRISRPLHSRRRSGDGQSERGRAVGG